MPRRTAGSLLLLLPLIAACSSDPEFILSGTKIDRVSWDSLYVSATFEELPTFGPPVSVRPDSLWTTVFNARYDTLYHGSSGLVAIPDADLGDREAVLLEICGTRKSRQACEQQSLTSSPKRIEAETDMRYPETESFERGTYRLSYTISRQVFGADDWEPVRRRVRPETYLLAYVDKTEADAVKIPVRPSRNRINLSRHARYRDFRFQIQSHFMDSDSALVHFDLFARLGPDAQNIARDSVVIRARSTEERRSELHNLVELAGGRIIDRMTGFFGARRAYVFINDWTYQALERVYSAEIELHWQSAFRREWYDMTGRLTMRANGTAAQYEWIQGSTSAAERWLARTDSTILFLNALRPNVSLRPEQETEDR